MPIAAYQSGRTTTQSSLPNITLWPLLWTICVLLIVAIHPATLFAFALSSLLVVFISRFFFRDVSLATSYRMHVLYCCLAILLYLWQLSTVPEFLGLSGPRGIGTDDAQYYYHASPETPTDFPIPWYGRIQPTPYSMFLRVFGNIIYGVTGQVHVLDLVLISVISLTFTPIVVSSLTKLITSNQKTAQLAFWFSALCPFMLANGLILLSDVWSGLLFACGLYFFLQRQFIALCLSIAFLAYLRPETALLLIGNLGLIYLYQVLNASSAAHAKSHIERLASLLGITVICLAVFAAFYPWLASFMQEKGITDGLFRQGYADGFMAEGDDGSSTLLRISRLPALLRIPLGTAFFVGAPFVSLKSLWFSGCTSYGFCYDNILIPRPLLTNLYALAFVAFYVRYFTQCVLRVLRGNSGIVAVILSLFIINSLLLSQVSLQGRHKLWIMPLFYVLVATGIEEKKSRNLMVYLITFVFVIVTLYINARAFSLI